jgi:hypothetical protein
MGASDFLRWAGADRSGNSCKTCGCTGNCVACQGALGKLQLTFAGIGAPTGFPPGTPITCPACADINGTYLMDLIALNVIISGIDFSCAWGQLMFTKSPCQINSSIPSQLIAKINANVTAKTVGASKVTFVKVTLGISDTCTPPNTCGSFNMAATWTKQYGEIVSCAFSETLTSPTISITDDGRGSFAPCDCSTATCQILGL